MALIAALALAAPAAAKAPIRPVVGEERPATANTFSRPAAYNSPALAADPTEGRFVALAERLDAPDFGCALQVSGDGGRGFVPANPVPTLPAGAEKCYAPEVAFDGSGRLYYLFVGLAGRTNVPMGVYLTTSVNRGRSFSPPRQLLGPNNFAVRMAIDTGVGRRGRIHLVWLAANATPGLGSLPPPPNPILAAHSDDGGTTFSPPVVVSDADRRLVVAPALVLGPRHAVHVVYYDLGADERDYHGLEGPTWDGNWSLVSSTSSDGGKRFAPGVVVDDAVVAPERVMLIFTMAPPSVAADGRGRLFVAWSDARNRDWDVFVRRSLDGGRRWQPPVRLNDDPLGDGRHQYLPKVSVAPGGRLDAVFYDRREDPDNVRANLELTFSSDGGRSFAPNVAVSGAPSDSRIGQSYVGPAAQGLVDFGSRLGLLSTEHCALVAWADTRNALRQPRQDVFAAQVQLSARPGRGRCP